MAYQRQKRIMFTKDFEAEINRRLVEATADGLSSIRLTAGEIHRALGGYPGKSHKLPSCCIAMNACMRSGDVVVSAPPKGRGATLTIEYKLPR